MASAIDEHVDEAEKHVLGALCEDLGGVNGQNCTKPLHFSNHYYPSVLQPALHPQSCRSCVAAAPPSAQIAGSTCESPARKHAHDEPREAQTASTRCATIVDRSTYVPGWMSARAGRRDAEEQLFNPQMLTSNYRYYADGQLLVARQHCVILPRSGEHDSIRISRSSTATGALRIRPPEYHQYQY